MSDSSQTVPPAPSADAKLIHENKLGKPLDFSFMGVKTVDKFSNVIPRTKRLNGTPKRGIRKKYISASICMNNNHLPDLSGLKDLVDDLFEFPAYLTWIDVSYNKLRRIDQDVVGFPHLRILYMHGNHIKNMEEVSKLRSLLQLRTLTLYGNPIARINNFRRYVLYYAPQIRSLDFSLITRVNREAIRPLGPVASAE